MTHRGVLHFARVSAESRALGPDDRVYAYAPMTHIFGLGTVLLASLHAGAALEMRAQFEPAELFDAVARRRVSQVQGRRRCIARRLHALALSVRWSRARIALKQQVEALFGQTLHHGYGLSEYAKPLHATRLGETRADTSAGYAFPGAELRIVDPADGRPCRPASAAKSGCAASV